jgi:hypothetical protein
MEAEVHATSVGKWLILAAVGWGVNGHAKMAGTGIAGERQAFLPLPLIYQSLLGPEDAPGDGNDHVRSIRGHTNTRGDRPGAGNGSYRRYRSSLRRQA